MCLRRILKAQLKAAATNGSNLQLLLRPWIAAKPGESRLAWTLVPRAAHRGTGSYEEGELLPPSSLQTCP